MTTPNTPATDRTDERLTQLEIKLSYTEDLLGYLLGRAHYQMLYALRQLLNTQALDERSFFILSVLSIRDRLMLDELNAFIAYTGMLATAESMDALASQRLVAIETEDGEMVVLSDEDLADLPVTEPVVRFEATDRVESVMAPSARRVTNRLPPRSVLPGCKVPDQE